jgi:NTE family protein
VPTSAREIGARINTITFNQPMLRDVEVIDTVRSLYSRWSRTGGVGDARLARHRFHLIEAGRFTSALAPESKAKPELELLLYLHGAGRSETEKWLERCRRSIGWRSTVDLRKHFLDRSSTPAAAGQSAPPTPEAAA